MCGIAGFSGDLGLDLLTRMSGKISHRGPDDSGVYHLPAKGIGLAHRRLSIIDLSPSGNQPMWDVTKRAAIVFNGEIYNYRKLRAEPSKATRSQFHSQTDTEVILHGVGEWGLEGCLQRLRGMYACALFDKRDHSMTLVLDPLGVKPLYYMQQRGILSFASEIRISA